jgi:hypothetical protein
VFKHPPKAKPSTHFCTMSTKPAAAFSASRAGGNSKTSDVVRYVVLYLDRRAEFTAGLHPHLSLTALHTGHAPLWDRQAMEGTSKQ